MDNSQKATEEAVDLVPQVPDYYSLGRRIGFTSNQCMKFSDECERAFREGRGSLKKEIFELIDDNESPDLIWLRKQIQEL